MPLAHETVVYDVHDFKVYPMTADSGASPTYGAAVDVPGIGEVSVAPNFVTAVLKGDAKVIARKGRIDAFGLSATYAKLDLDVLEVILEGTVTDSGSTPNQKSVFSMLGDNGLPYFKAAFQIEDVDVGIGAVRCILHKCQISGGTLLGGTTDEFGRPTFELQAIPAESNDAFIDVELWETATALS